MKRRLLLFAFIASYSVVLFPQETDSVNYPTFKVDGVMKNKFEYASEISTTRFTVRSSRIGVGGKIAQSVSYRAQLELSDNGNFRVLDLYGTLEPFSGFSFSLGQVNIPLFNSYITNPGAMMFANRAFLGKYFLSTRDIGAMTKYEFEAVKIPVCLEFGVFNGNVINDPVWQENLSYGGRIQLGSMKGLRATTKIYNYSNSATKHYLIYGADIRYEGANWKIETEILKRDDQIDPANSMRAYYLQGAYAFSLQPDWIFKNLIPAVRWDAIDKSLNHNRFDVNRLTVGLGLGFKKKLFSSLLRFDYEKYFVNQQLDIMNTSPEMDSDKFTIELLLTF